jgi:N-acetylmuramic acid 6-phosphate (MurNAc-6-P) etherase
MKIETVCPSRTLVNSTRLHGITSQKVVLFMVKSNTVNVVVVTSAAAALNVSEDDLTMHI